MTAKTLTYNELLSEYKFALGIWAETKALYSPDGPEVFQATLQLEMLEDRLIQHRVPTVMPQAA